MSDASAFHLATPLGAVCVQVFGNADGQASGQIEVQIAADEAELELPDGMRVDKAVRIELTVRALADGVAPRILFMLDESLGLGGHPGTGEWLESIEFERGGTMLSLGARDPEWMLTYGLDRSLVPGRFGLAASYDDADGYRVRYTRHGMIVSFGALARGETLTCPLALAYVSGLSEPNDDVSTWFAVDNLLPLR
jgi:hypothetical protein